MNGYSDLYVLGLLFFEMLTGKPVIDSDLAMTSILTQQLQEELKIPPASETRLPPALDAMARELLAVEPTRRAADATAVRRAFAAWATTAPTPPGPASAAADAARAMGDRIVAGSSAIWTKAAPVVADAGRTSSDAMSGLLRRLRERRASKKDLAVAGAALASTLFLCVALGYVAQSGRDAALAAGAAAALDPELGADAGPPGPVTITLSEVEDALLNGRTRAAREAAAGTVLSAEAGAYPRYARLVAVLALTDGCAARRTQIEAIGALGDIRAMPALARIDRGPTTGCGRRSREDCYACARAALATAIAALEASGGIAPE